MKFLFVALSREENPKGIWNTPHKLNRFLKEKGHETLYLTVPKKISLFFILWYGLSFMFRYLRFRPDVIISLHQLAFFPIFFRKLGIIRKPVIYYWYDLDFEAMGKAWGVEKIAFLELYCVKNADAVFTNSRFQQEIANRFDVRCIYFPQGVEPYFNKDTSSAKLNGKNKFKALFVGDVIKYKRIPELINSMRNVKADLFIIGPVNEELGVRIPENVHFLGFKKQEEIPAYMKAADIMIVPTDQDGTLKMFEALKMGKCILAFQGRISYVLTHMENAYLCREFDKGMNFLISNPEIIKKIERNNSQLKLASLDEVYNSQLKEIKKLVGN